MKIDIYIQERNGSRSIRVPWLPDSIKIASGGTTLASYDIMNKGEVAIPMGSGLGRWSWTSVFPGENRTDTSLMRGEWKAPKTYHNIIEDWRANGTPLKLMVTGYPINKDVLLEDYEATAGGGFGDIEYTISFVEDRKLTITSTNEEEASDRPTAETTTYVVKEGDTLWSIAERFLGSGSKWKLIYEANKDIIESVAKERWKAAGIDRDSEQGHWIFPGTKLSIPQ